MNWEATWQLHRSELYILMGSLVTCIAAMIRIDLFLLRDIWSQETTVPECDVNYTSLSLWDPSCPRQWPLCKLAGNVVASSLHCVPNSGQAKAWTAESTHACTRPLGHAESIFFGLSKIADFIAQSAFGAFQFCFLDATAVNSTSSLLI